jgi:hypothetical protein
MGGPCRLQATSNRNGSAAVLVADLGGLKRGAVQLCFDVHAGSIHVSPGDGLISDSGLVGGSATSYGLAV